MSDATLLPSMIGGGITGPRLIAVASGKGGVGKTWFAITLAHALAGRGARTLLFDGDLGLANVDIQLGLTPQRDVGALFDGAALASCVTAYEPGGFDIVAGRSGSGSLAAIEPASLELVLSSLRDAAGYDAVVLDLGAGLDRTMRRMAMAADTLLVLATEEPTSLTDAYAVLKLYAADQARGEARKADARIVINQASSDAAGQRTYTTLARACANFLGSTPPLAGIVPRDDRVRDSIRRQMPLLARHPAAPAGRAVERIAAGVN